MLNHTFKNINQLNTALDGSWLRNKTISNNIANVNTPGYKRQVVQFEDVLRNEMSRANQLPMSVTHENHLPHANKGQIQVNSDSSTSYRVDGNNVDIDVEMGEMAKNSIYYNSIVNQLNGQFSRMKMSLNINK